MKHLRKNNGRFTRSVKGARVALALIFVLVLMIAKGYGDKIEFVPLSPVKDVHAYAWTITPTPVPTWDQVSKMVIDEFKDLGPKRVSEALKISYCESRWNPKAIHVNTNGSVDKGTFQLNSVHNLPDSVTMDTLANIKWAKAKFIRDGNWNAWSCRKVL